MKKLSLVVIASMIMLPLLSSCKDKAEKKEEATAETEVKEKMEVDADAERQHQRHRHGPGGNRAGVPLHRRCKTKHCCARQQVSDKLHGMTPSKDSVIRLPPTLKM